MTKNIELTEAIRAEIIAAIEAADLESPEQVADLAIDAAEQGRDWQAVLAQCVANESREYDYATDGEMGVIRAVDFADACRKLDAMFTPAILADGGQGWVEDHDGERYRIGYDAE